mmetsp:Transcript_60922/g.199466  ORF Transcript_60922/g.199466 Transcript_60922/m.199466 type:complete len:500 (+) Transcript_60922:76-1575(+)
MEIKNDVACGMPSLAAASQGAPLLQEDRALSVPAGHELHPQVQTSPASNGTQLQGAADAATLTVVAAVVEEAPSCCSSGWPQMWVMVPLDMISGIIMVLSLPDIGAAYFNGGIDPCAAGASRDAPACKEALGKFAGLMTSVGLGAALLQFGFGPFVGAAADRVGTKPLLVAAALVKVFTGLFFAGLAFGYLSIYYVIISAEVNALLNPVLTYTLWIIERTRPENRSIVFARLGAVITLDGIVAPLLAMFLKPQSAAIVVLALSAIVLVAAICLPGSPRPGVDTGRLASLPGTPRQSIGQQLRGMLKLFAHPQYRFLIMLALLGGALGQGGAAVLFLYVKERFGMTLHTVAPFLALSTLSSVVAQICLMKPLQRRLGLKGIVLMGLLIGVVTSTGILLAPSPVFLLPVAVVNGLSSLAQPGISAAIANLPSVDEGKLGVTLGAAYSVCSVSAIVGPLLFRALFAWGFAGLPWIFTIVVEFAAMLLLAKVPSNLFPSANEP